MRYEIKSSSPHNFVEVEVMEKGKSSRISSKNVASHTREVYLFPEFVVKMDNYQTFFEIEFYKNILPKDKKFFPKLLGHGMYGDKAFIIQERIFGYEQAFVEGKVTDKHLKEFGYLLNEYEMHDIELEEDMSWNVMITDEGELKVFDMGLC